LRDLRAQRIEPGWEPVLVQVWIVLPRVLGQDAVDLLKRQEICVGHRCAELDQLGVDRVTHQHHDQFVQADLAWVAPWGGDLRFRQAPNWLRSHVISGLRASLDQSLVFEHRIRLEDRADAHGLLLAQLPHRWQALA
jgi:hypothetical protein